MMSREWKCVECVKHNTDACYNGGKFDDDNCKYMLIDVDYAYQQGKEDREKELAELPNQYSERLWKNAYDKGRADAIEELKSKTDCENSECYNCAMADGDMNCMLGLLELKEQK